MIKTNVGKINFKLISDKDSDVSPSELRDSLRGGERSDQHQCPPPVGLHFQKNT